MFFERVAVRIEKYAELFSFHLRERNNFPKSANWFVDSQKNLHFPILYLEQYSMPVLHCFAKVIQ